MKQKPSGSYTDPPMPPLLEENEPEYFSLFHDPSGTPYVTFHQYFPKETVPIQSVQFREFIERIHYQKYRKPISPKTLKSFIAVLSNRAKYDEPMLDVHKRCAHVNDRVFIDLLNQERQIVEVDSQGWRIRDDYSVKFIRMERMQALPVPQGGESITLFRKFLNLQDEDAFILLLGWMVESYIQGRPKPILNIQGEQGSAKSTMTKVVRALIDPHLHPISRFPSSARDLYTLAQDEYVLAFDNLAQLSVQQANDLCQISTEGSMKSRTIYQEGRSTSLKAKQPVILNGILPLSQRSDLLQRMIILHLPPISRSRRMEERVFLSEFEQAKPYIFGALLDGLSHALGHVDRVHFPQKSRMADFERFASAAMPAFGYTEEHFQRAYQTLQRHMLHMASEEDEVVQGIQELMHRERIWEGTLDALRKQLDSILQARHWKTKNFPDSIPKMSYRIREVSPLLRELGIDVVVPDRPTYQKEYRRGMRIYRIQRRDRESDRE